MSYKQSSQYSYASYSSSTPIELTSGTSSELFTASLTTGVYMITGYCKYDASEAVDLRGSSINLVDDSDVLIGTQSIFGIGGIIDNADPETSWSAILDGASKLGVSLICNVITSGDYSVNALSNFLVNGDSKYYVNSYNITIIKIG